MKYTWTWRIDIGLLLEGLEVLLVLTFPRVSSPKSKYANNHSLLPFIGPWEADQGYM